MSCVSKKDLNYFQSNIDNKGEIKNYEGPKLEIGDIIQITIYSNNEELNKLFATSDTRNSENRQNYTSGSPVFGGFEIDLYGNIKLPYVGQIKLAGLTKFESEDLIKQKLKQFIIEPIAQIQLMNFKISVLGDVKTPGVYQVPNNKINLLEAIALSGDLNFSADRRNVKLIRNTNGNIKTYEIDLTNSSVIEGEPFFLKQNDILYVSTTSFKANQLNFSQYLSPSLSAVSILMNLFILLR
jgi:polysaccharide export outer membrane protein